VTVAKQKTTVVAKLRNLLPGLILSAVTVVICLLLLEAGLRIAGVKPVEAGNTGDIDLGFRNQPASTQVKSSFPEYSDGYLLMRTNNRQFFEDVDTPAHKPPGTRRIAIVGDSQTAGGCLNRESYPNRLEALLTARDPRHPADVLNGGVGRYSTYQSLMRAKVDMLPLEPDHIVLAVYLGNDLLDAVRTDDRPYLEEQPDGSFEKRPPVFIVFADPHSHGNWITNSRTAELVRKAAGPTLLYSVSRFRLLLHNINAPVTQPMRVLRYMRDIRALSVIDLGFVTQVLNQHHWFLSFPETLPRARRTHREVLRLAQEMCRQRGIRLSVLLVPAKVQIEPQFVEEALQKMQTVELRLAVAPVQSFLDDYAASVVADGAALGIEVIDPRQKMKEAAQGRELYYRRDMHLNVTGNQILAGILAEKIQ